MKKTLVMASLVAASTSMMAMDLEYFLGAGAERANFNTRSSGSDGFNNESNLKDTSLLLKAGIILDKTHRISLSHTKLSKDNSDITTILGSYDYLIPMNEQFSLYAGLHAGNTKVEVDAYEKISFSGLAYGAQVGALYDITKNIEFELGLAYTKYNVERAEDMYWYKLEVEDSTSMFAGINYKF